MVGITKLTGIRNRDGTVTLQCPDCRTVPEKQYGAPNEDHLAYILSCSKCQNILGQWTTAEERDVDLHKFAANLAKSLRL